MQNKPITFQFISEPSDVNYGGNVHGGSVMKWIDQAGYACATTWSGNYSVTVYVGGIRFYDPIKIGEVVKVDAQVIYTGTSSMHIAINVFSRNLKQPNFDKKNTLHYCFCSCRRKRKKITGSKMDSYHRRRKTT